MRSLYNKYILYIALFITLSSIICEDKKTDDQNAEKHTHKVISDMGIKEDTVMTKEKFKIFMRS